MSLISRAAVALVLAVPIVCHAAAAAWKPEQNVEIIIPATAGSGSDDTGRWMQRLLAEKKLIEVPTTVVNKPGGAATVGLVYLNQHPGNGHYLMVSTPAMLTTYIMGINPVNYTDTTPLAVIGSESVIFTVRADSPLKSAKDLADRFKADPASISVAFANTLGNQNHVAAAQVAKGVGTNVKSLKTVVFNGSSESLAALLGGHVGVMTVSASAVLDLFTTGKVRILAVSAERRLGGVLAVVPTWKELGIASVSSNWRPIIGPKGMSEEQIRYWDEVLAKFAQLPEWKQFMEARLVEDTYLNARDTRKRMDAQYAELAVLLSELGLASSAPARGR